MTPKTSRVLVLVLVLLIAVMGSTIAFAFTSTQPGYTNPSNSTNKDDATNYITASDSNGLITIQNKVNAGDQTLWVGTKRVIGDYMYVYGYYYDSNSAPNTSNLTGWKLQTTDLGWGCAALNKTKTSYADPAGVIEGHTVTWMTHAYSGCTKLTTAAATQYQLPRIPATVKHTDYMFSSCTGLQRASLTTANVLTANTFNGCSNLQQIFIGRNVETVKANAFSGVNSACKLYLEVVSKPSGFASNWSKGIASTKYDADILIWATTDNY